MPAAAVGAAVGTTLGATLAIGEGATDDTGDAAFDALVLAAGEAATDAATVEAIGDGTVDTAAEAAGLLAFTPLAPAAVEAAAVGALPPKAGGATGAPRLPGGRLLSGTFTPSKTLLVACRVEVYARMREVVKKITAHTPVTLVRRLPAPLAPKTVWLDPPKTAPTSAPLPCWSKTTPINVTQTRI